MSAIEVRKQGRRYTLNGEIVTPSQFYGIGAFKWCNHIWAWIQGGAHGMGGGEHLDNAKRYVEREVLGNGCRRMRAPVELTLWTGPYFDVAPNAPEPWRGWTNVANGLDLVDLRASPGSHFRLTSGMKKLIRMYVVIAREFDIVIEVPWLWTIKSQASGEALNRLGLDDDPRLRWHRAPEQAKGGSQHGVAVWNEHFLAAQGIGAYLRVLREEGDGEGEHRVDPGGLNVISDLMNERTAHVPEIWNQKTLGQVAQRFRVRDTQGELALISQSGPIDSYDTPLASQHGAYGYDGVAGHFPRSGEWAKTGTVARAKWPQELIDANEAQMGWTAEQRAAWVELIDKWEGLGSTDLETWIRMHDNFVSEDIYTTFHTLRAMDAGWPHTPQTLVEERIREFTGAGGGADPPPPLQRFRYAPVIALAFHDILGREPDPGGLENYDRLMGRGMTEAELREALLRSAEYEERNPE